jgi:NDP-sugar pyrophosphorylase family protein
MVCERGSVTDRFRKREETILKWQIRYERNWQYPGKARILRDHPGGGEGKKDEIRPCEGAAPPLRASHAVLQAAEAFRDHDGTIVILCGDVPLIRPEMVRSLYDRHRMEGATVTVLTTIPEDPAGYGRVVKADGGHVVKIVEERMPRRRRRRSARSIRGSTARRAASCFPQSRILATGTPRGNTT